jgi:hypothetical protein
MTQNSFQNTVRLPQQSPMQQLRVVPLCTQNARNSWVGIVTHSIIRPLKEH